MHTLQSIKNYTGLRLNVNIDVQSLDALLKEDLKIIGHHLSHLNY